MAEKTETPEANEKPTIYGKKAQIVVFVLIGIIFLGLVLQTYLNYRNRQHRDADQEAKLDAKEAQGRSTRPPSSINDFDKAQRKAENAIDASKKADNEDSRRKHVLRALENSGDGNGDATAGSGTDTSSQTTESVEQAYRVAEMKIALEAGRGKIGRADRNASGQRSGAAGEQIPTATGNAAELNRVEDKIKTLRTAPAQIDQRKQEILGRLSALGIPVPPDLAARASGSAITPGAAAAAPNRLSQPAGQAGNQSFGELVNNRVARDPTNSGPRPGESILSTSTILSAVVDMDMMSDYAGNCMLLIQRPVYDAPMENILLPAGTKITCKTARVTLINEPIQNRMAFTPIWAIRPDGKRIDFRRASGMDTAGVAALKDKVDHHVLAQVFGVGAYAVIGIGPSMSNYGAEPNSSRDAFVREATQQARTQGRAFAEKYLSIVPTLTISAGTPAKIFIEDDIYVTPWEPVDAGHFNNVR